MTVKDFDFAGNKDGLLLAGTSNCTLANMSLGNNRLYVTSGNVTVLWHWGGLVLFESNNNTIEDCMIRDSSYGVCLYYSDWNLFLHDSFAGNDRDVASDYYWLYGNYSSGYFSSNFWDDDHPSSGNYWSDYNGTDSNGDGIGDTPYIIDANNTDHYPLMSPYSYWTNPALYDLNRDMKVDMKDVALAAACFGSRAGDPKWNSRADVTGDGILDIRDLVAVARSFGERYS